MAKLENNYTTSKQSECLLQLGMPANTADCFRVVSGLMECTPQILDCSFSEQQKRYEDGFPKPTSIEPVWSSGRLLEIWDLCVGEYELFSRNYDKSLLDDIFTEICAEIISTTEHWDFSKLEDK